MKRIVLLALMLAAPGAASAGTNFPALRDYPAPDCVRPGDKPVMAQDAPKVVDAGGVSFKTGTRDVRTYNEQIAAYNVALAAYTRCLNAYVDNAQADMNAIRDKVNQAVTTSQAP
jgi:hypothetical protein